MEIGSGSGLHMHMPMPMPMPMHMHMHMHVPCACTCLQHGVRGEHGERPQLVGQRLERNVLEEARLLEG